MLFNSYVFLFIFLPVALLGCYLLADRGWQRAAMVYLVGMSLFFYGWWNPVYLWLLGVSIGANFTLGMALNGTAGDRARRALLVLGVCFNLGLLGYFKYANFFVDSVNDALGTSFVLEIIVLPLAISFFTFQQITYIVDTWKGIVREHSFLHYCLFVTFFPQLLAGPIVHHKEMLPQFREGRAMRFSHSNLAVGSALLVLGLFKKVIMADSLGAYAAPTFELAEQGGTVYFLPGWIAAIAFTLGVYFDFSAYSDMALGLARMFGIHLPINFLSPMKARNIIELWQGWHITLTRFLRNYIFKPLGGAQRGTGRRHLNTLITMLLGGLWHGASWNFVIWGGLNGLFLVINHLWITACQLVGWQLGSYRAWRIFSHFLTFNAFCAAAVFFKAETFGSAAAVLRGMFGLNGFAMSEFILSSLLKGGLLNFLLFYGQGLAMIVWTLLMVLAMPNVYQIMGRGMAAADFYPRRLYRYKGTRLLWQPDWRWATALAALALVVLHYMAADVQEFIYFQF
jgi:D-alanyl-lipoteichoic acid acyltransferase DltB (MBOAT superfamily)